MVWGLRVVGTRELAEFARRHPDVRTAVQSWLQEAEDATWRTPQEIRERYVSASFVQENGVVFNLAGNKYRLFVKVAYGTGIVRIMRIGKHSDYDSWRLNP